MCRRIRRATSGEGRFVAGPFDGNLSARETLLLKDREDRVRAPAPSELRWDARSISPEDR